MSTSESILVVDDDEAQREVFVLVLTAAGFDVRAATGGEEALAFAIARPPALVLADVQMPGLDGPALCRRIRAEPGLERTLVILASGARTTSDEQAEGLESGADGYVALPVSNRELVARVRSMLRVHRAEAARAAAEGASRAKSAFLASVSHELRTPLNAIIGFSDLLLEGHAGPLLPLQREYLTDVAASGRHLLALVDDVLDLAKIEAGRVELDWAPVRLEDLARSAAGALRPLALAQQVSLVLDVPGALPRLVADPVRLTQILYNLLSNALKFTPAGGRVTLRAAAAAGGVVLTVEDTGVGIAPGDATRLFHEFERVRPSDGHGPEGTGLGLALTKRLVELHCGTIRVDSAPGHGSSFQVSLPCRPPDAPPLSTGDDVDPAGGHPDLAAPRPRPRSILLVEDNRLNAKLVRSVLGARGHEVTVAGTLAEAERLWRAGGVDLVLLDLALPDGRGEALLEAIRGDARSARLPVVVVTACALRGDRERLLAIGADEYLTKPIAPAILCARVEGLFARQRPASSPVVE